MKLKIIPSVILSFAIAAGAVPTVAGTVAQERDKLERLEQTFENRQVAYEDIENEVLAYTHKLEKARADLKAARQEALDDSDALSAAKDAVKADASEENRRALKLAMHADKMAQRSVRTATKRLEWAEQNWSELQTKQAKAKSDLDALQQRISAQETYLQSTINRIEREAQTAAREKAAREVAERQLKAAAQARAQAQRELARMAEEKEAAQQALEQAQAATSQPGQSGLQTQPVTATQEAEMSELDKEALAYAQAEVARLESVLSSGKKGRPHYKRLVLRSAKAGASSFEFLGQNQYRTEVQVEKGKQFFQVGRHKFRRTIPAADDGTTYVVIFDARRLTRPRLVMYKKSLLDHI